MNIGAFIQRTGIIDKTELDKVCYIYYYYLITEDKRSFSVNEASDWLVESNFHKPNISRLNNNIKKSSKFVKGVTKDTYTLHAKEINKLKEEISFLDDNNDEIITQNEILPEQLYINTRSYIENLSKQINCAYENNIFDGCSVLMRRLLEILLIHSYECNKIEDDIRGQNGEYKMLNEIIENAKSNKVLSLSRNTKEHIDDFRLLGNFSAHKIYYNTKKSDIKRVMIEYRACIEELLYKSGIKK